MAKKLDDQRKTDAERLPEEGSRTLDRDDRVTPDDRSGAGRRRYTSPSDAQDLDKKSDTEENH